MDYERLEHDLKLAAARLAERGRRRRRAARISTAAGLSVLAVAGAAAGAARLLGWPAPDHVRAEISSVDRGLPAELRLNPQVEGAKAVASSGGSTLYAAGLSDGGFCTVIVTAGDRGRGPTCSSASDIAANPIQVTLPTDEPRENHVAVPVDTLPVTVGGRLNVAVAASLAVRYGAAGPVDSIPLGDDRFFIFDVPSEHLLLAHTLELVFVARDARGVEVARQVVPADWDGPAAPDELAPLYVNTRSDEGDLTKVYGIEGHVAAEGATRLELIYADGEHVEIPLAPDGAYDYTVPAERVSSFMRPQTLAAVDGAGKAVAEAPVAAVAYWTGRARGR